MKKVAKERGRAVGCTEEGSEVGSGSDMTELDGLKVAALKIAHQDAALRKSLKEAILRDDVAKTLETACALVGIKPSGSILAATIKAKSDHPADAKFVTPDG